MSSAAAAPPLPAAETPRGARRPSALTVYRWELRKLVAQKRTYIGCAFVCALPLIFVIVENIHQQQGHRDNIYAAQISQSGLATPVLMLLFLSVFLLPVVAALVAGDIVANEDGNGTLKTILTRSVDRGQVYVAKMLAAFSYAVAALFLSAAVSTVAGVASWGFHSITTYSGTVVSAPKALLLVFGANVCYLVPLLAVASFALMLSATTRNSVASVFGAIGLIILLLIVGQIPGLQGIHPYLLQEQFEAWHGLLRTPTDWAPIWHSVWVCALYAVPSLIAGYLVFLRRDVAGG